MSSPFIVCSYNMGIGIQDYRQLYLHSGIAEENWNLTEQHYDGVQKEAAEALLNSQSSVYCLQEVGDDKRPLMQTLKEKEFEIVRCQDIEVFDVAIAIDKSRFKEIKNHSFRVQKGEKFLNEVAIATAVDRQTQQKVAFVSAHPYGFDFCHQKEEQKAKEAGDGDYYCQALADKLATLGGTHFQIIGSDLNANPEIWSARLEIFTQKGFQTLTTSKATNVNYRDSKFREREIDFMFAKTIAKSTFWGKIKSVFRSFFELKASIEQNPTDVTWDVKKNASDHLPIFTRVTAEVKSSKLSRIWNVVCRLFHFKPGRL